MNLRGQSDSTIVSATTLKHIRGLLQVGSKHLSPIECLAAFLLPLCYMLSSATDLKNLLLLNFKYQFVEFLVVVQLPLAITGKMAYVDIGWPLGLTLLGYNGLVHGTGWFIRRYVVCGCMMLHGLRMLVGALCLFYPYTFPNGDLSRYQYAKYKWIHEEKLSEMVWPLKAQLDTLTQCFANSMILACPILLAALNPLPHFHFLELCGIALWVVAWSIESAADIQKHSFLQECKRQAMVEGVTKVEKDQLKFAVLGHAPFNSAPYWLWTKCRHPNYFCEWVSWVGFAVVGCGSVLTKDEWLTGGGGLPATVLLVATLLLLLRFFYDCLVYWTGAAPAEQQSVQKRPLYAEYQRTTRVFFPFDVPFVNHHMSPGWPWSEKEALHDD